MLCVVLGQKFFGGLKNFLLLIRVALLFKAAENLADEASF